MKSINYTKGDATAPIGSSKKLIVHICNDIGGWGRGFVVAISKRWAAPEQQYREWHQTQDKFELGEVQFVAVQPGIAIANMIAQHKIHKTNGQPPIRYEAVEKCLEKVAVYALENGYTIHMPRIGCGLAGGKWEEIEKIIDRQLLSKQLEVTVYDFE